MPEVVIHLLEGRTLEQKRGQAHRLSAGSVSLVETAKTSKAKADGDTPPR